LCWPAERNSEATEIQNMRRLTRQCCAGQGTSDATGADIRAGQGVSRLPSKVLLSTRLSPVAP
jgi:hypothetical protein